MPLPTAVSPCRGNGRTPLVARRSVHKLSSCPIHYSSPVVLAARPPDRIFCAVRCTIFFLDRFPANGSPHTHPLTLPCCRTRRLRMSRSSASQPSIRSRVCACNASFPIDWGGFGRIARFARRERRTLDDLHRIRRALEETAGTANM